MKNWHWIRVWWKNIWLQTTTRQTAPHISEIVTANRTLWFSCPPKSSNTEAQILLTQRSLPRAILTDPMPRSSARLTSATARPRPMSVSHLTTRNGHPKRKSPRTAVQFSFLKIRFLWLPFGIQLIRKLARLTDSIPATIHSMELSWSRLTICQISFLFWSDFIDSNFFYMHKYSGGIKSLLNSIQVLFSWLRECNLFSIDLIFNEPNPIRKMIVEWDQSVNIPTLSIGKYFMRSINASQSWLLHQSYCEATHWNLNWIRSCFMLNWHLRRPFSLDIWLDVRCVLAVDVQCSANRSEKRFKPEKGIYALMGYATQSWQEIKNIRIKDIRRLHRSD